MTTDAAFAALANGSRRRILDTIADHGPQSHGALVRTLDITKGGVTQHLGILREAGLVAQQRGPAGVRYVIDRAGLTTAERWMRDLDRFWDDRLDRLVVLAEQGARPARSDTPGTGDPAGQARP